MGFGGALIWTGIAYNLKKKYPDKSLIFIYEKPLRAYLKRKPVSDHIIYLENKSISFIYDKLTWFLKKRFYKKEDILVLYMDNPDYHYWNGSTKEKVFYKEGMHAIQFACNYFNIKNADLKPELNLTKNEINNAKEVMQRFNLFNTKYICIEPHAKIEFTPNKEWFWENWIALIQKLNIYFKNSGYEIKLVQLGVSTDKVLDNVLDLTGMTSFREAAYLLKHSLMFIGYMGGLVHLNKSVDKKSIVLVSAFEPLELATYPDDINLYTDIECKNCGLKIPCPKNRQCMKEIKVDDVFKSSIYMLKNVLGEIK